VIACSSKSFLVVGWSILLLPLLSHPLSTLVYLRVFLLSFLFVCLFSFDLFLFGFFFLSFALSLLYSFPLFLFGVAFLSLFLFVLFFVRHFLGLLLFKVLIVL